MRAGRTLDVGFELPFDIKVKFDGWDVLLGASILVLILTALIEGMRPWGWWTAAGLLVLWLVLTLIFRPTSSEE
jgi:hypothetical protein